MTLFLSALSSVPQALFLSLGLRYLSEHLSHVLEKGPHSQPTLPGCTGGQATGKAGEVISFTSQPASFHPFPPHPQLLVSSWSQSSTPTRVCGLIISDFQENVDCPGPPPWVTEVTKTLPSSSPGICGMIMGRGLQFHGEVKNERASFYGTFGMTGIGGLSPLHPALPCQHPRPSLGLGECSFAGLWLGRTSSSSPLLKCVCPV